MKLKLQIGILAILGLMLIFSASLMANTEEEPVEFQNRDIELAVKQQLGKATGDVYPSELLELRGFRSPLHLKIEDLSWIKHCKNLENLALVVNEIKDISPLSSLRDLRSLRLQGNNISNLGPLSGLYKIQYANLRGNEITDIQPLIDNYKVKENGEKIGLGEGDKVNVSKNYLDLSEGSEDLQDIQTLIDRGVKVEYYPQKEETS